MKAMEPLRPLRDHQSPHHGLRGCAVKLQVCFGYPGRCGEAALVCRIIAAERADVVEGPRFAGHDPVGRDQVGMAGIGRLLGEGRLIKSGGQHVDEVDIARELAVLLSRDAGRHEDSQVANGLVNRVDDRLSMLSNIVDILVKVEDPAQRLLRWCNVVALRAEHDDRRADIAKIDQRAVRGLDSSRREIVADEQLIHDELDFLGIEVDVTAPIALEAEIARGLRVDLVVKVVLLGPERVRGIEVLEVLHEPGPVELAAAEIARKCCEPAPAEEPARIAHGVLAAHARPIRQGRASNNDGTEELRAGSGQDHNRPAGLAVADHTGLSISLRMQLDDFLEERRFGQCYVLDGLPRHRIRQEADEIARMAGLHRDADFAVGFEAADSGAVSGARVHHHERPARHVDLDPFGWYDPNEAIIDRPR